MAEKHPSPPSRLRVLGYDDDDNNNKDAYPITPSREKKVECDVLKVIVLIDVWISNSIKDAECHAVLLDRQP